MQHESETCKGDPQNVLFFLILLICIFSIIFLVNITKVLFVVWKFLKTLSLFFNFLCCCFLIHILFTSALTFIIFFLLLIQFRVYFPLLFQISLIYSKLLIYDFFLFLNVCICSYKFSSHTALSASYVLVCGVSLSLSSRYSLIPLVISSLSHWFFGCVA